MTRGRLDLLPGLAELRRDGQIHLTSRTTVIKGEYSIPLTVKTF